MFRLRASRLVAPSFAFLLLLLGQARSVRADDDVLLQAFWWDSPQGWWKTLHENAYDFAKAGFRRVWIPPVSKDAAGGYGMGYGTYDGYDLGEYDQMGTIPTRFGTRQELQDMTWRMNELGLDPIGDMNLTHRNGGQDEAAPDGSHTWTKFNFPHERFQLSWWDFQHGHIEWKFGEHLNYWNDYVRHGLKEWGTWLTDTIGLKGYRIDQAKGLDPAYLREFLGHGSMYGKFAVSEYWDTNLDKLDEYVHASGAKVFDFPLFYKLQEMANDHAGFFDMRRLVGAGYVSRNPYGAVTFVENHDTDRSQPISFDKMMAYSYILFSEGTPTVFLKDYWEYGMKGQIDPLVAIRRTLLAGGTRTLYADQNLLVLQRDGWDGQPGGVLVLNNHGQDTRSAWVSVKPEWSGQDLVDHTGNQGNRPVQGDGRVELSAGPRGYAIYSIKIPGFDAKNASFAPGPDPRAQAADGIPLDLAKADPALVRAHASPVSGAVQRDGQVDVKTDGVLGALGKSDALKDRIDAATTIGAEDGR